MSSDWSQTFRTAERHLASGRITAAIEEYHKLVNWDPADLTTLNTLGDLYARAGLTDDAKRIFSSVAQGYSHQGFTSKAIALLKKILRIDPGDLDAGQRLADSYLAQGLLGEAGRQYATVADACERAGRQEQALVAYQRMAEIDPSNTPLLMMLGERWQREGLAKRAHSSFTAAADEYSKQGDGERALAAYLKAHAALPDDHKTLAGIAFICEARGQVESAIPILSESISRNSSDAELHRIIGSAYLSAGRLDDASRTFQKLLALDCNEYRNMLIVAERFLDNGEADRAVEQVDWIVDSLIANRREQEAVDFLRKVLDHNPEHSSSLRMLARIFRRLREDFNLAPTLKALVRSALRRGDREEAIEALKELCSLEPNEQENIDTLRNLGIETAATAYSIYPAAERNRDYPSLTGVDTKGNLPLTAFDWPNDEYEDYESALLKSLRRNVPRVTDDWLELAGEECFQMSELRNDRPAFALSPFVPATEIYGATRFSQHSISPLGDPFEMTTGFELVPGNRRRTARVSARVPLVVISDSGGWREFTQTVDVSNTGLRFQLAHSIPPMTVLSVSLDLAKWPAAIARTWAMTATEAVVRYCRQTPGQPSLVGVDFLANPQML